MYARNTENMQISISNVKMIHLGFTLLKNKIEYLEGIRVFSIVFINAGLCCSYNVIAIQFL